MDKQIEVAIPAGVEDGSRIRVSGQGDPPDLRAGGGVPGDLYVGVRVRPHEFFRRAGNDLQLDFPITVAQAALGDEVEIPTLQSTARLKVAPGTQFGKILRVKGEGVANLRDGRRGDLQVRLLVVVPTDLSAEQRELLHKLDASFRSSAEAEPRGIFERVRDALGV
jgi:molecular chaperone DnaJ